jgi:hypothetical protein
VTQLYIVGHRGHADTGVSIEAEPAYGDRRGFWSCCKLVLGDTPEHAIARWRADSWAWCAGHRATNPTVKELAND